MVIKVCTMGKRKRNVCPQIYVNCCKHPPPPPPVPCPLLPRHPFHPSTQSPPSIKMSRPKKRAAITQQNNNPTTFSKKDNNNKKYQHQNWNVSKIIQSESNPNPIRIQSESNPKAIQIRFISSLPSSTASVEFRHRCHINPIQFKRIEPGPVISSLSTPSYVNINSLPPAPFPSATKIRPLINF